MSGFEAKTPIDKMIKEWPRLSALDTEGKSINNGLNANAAERLINSIDMRLTIINGRERDSGRQASQEFKAPRGTHTQKEAPFTPCYTRTYGRVAR